MLAPGQENMTRETKKQRRQNLFNRNFYYLTDPNVVLRVTYMFKMLMNLFIYLFFYFFIYYIWFYKR